MDNKKRNIRVLIIDDSLFMRQIISDVLNSDPDIEVVGTAIQGDEGINKIKELKPDVVTLDYQMPGIDGVTTLQMIMRDHPVPVVMISAYTKEGGEITLKALREGAIDYILKPSGEISLDLKIIESEIISKVKTAAEASVEAIQESIHRGVDKLPLPHKIFEGRVVAIGSSTGGTKGVEFILRSLPAEFPLPILIVQHMPKMFTSLFAKRLNTLTEIKVKEAEDGEEVRGGVAYIAPGGWHMIISAKEPPSAGFLIEPVIKLTKNEPVYGLRPSVDILFKSVANVYGKNSIAAILSGMGSDGALGMQEIYNVGGATIAQDKKSSIVFGMPKSAIEMGIVRDVLPIDSVALRILELIALQPK
jgi:two-component system, chemotaxis family, protein-glutamate methylesterase/glutaminase